MANDPEDRGAAEGSAGAASSAGAAGGGSGPDRERDDERERERERERGRGGFAGYARRVIKAGADAIMDPDELIKRFVPELPREVAAYLLRVGEDVRDDTMRIFGRELRRFLEAINLTEEIQKILTATSFEIKTEIRFIPNDQSVLKSQRKTKVRIKRRGKDGEEEVIEERESEDGGPTEGPGR